MYVFLFNIIKKIMFKKYVKYWSKLKKLKTRMFVSVVKSIMVVVTFLARMMNHW